MISPIKIDAVEVTIIWKPINRKFLLEKNSPKTNKDLYDEQKKSPLVSSCIEQRLKSIFYFGFIASKGLDVDPVQQRTSEVKRQNAQPSVVKHMVTLSWLAVMVSENISY